MPDNYAYIKIKISIHKVMFVTEYYIIVLEQKLPWQNSDSTFFLYKKVMLLLRFLSTYLHIVISREYILK